MGKINEIQNDRQNVGKQNKFKMIIIYRKVAVKVRITKYSLKTEKLVRL